MPIYEYRCVSCGHELERIQRMSDDPLTDCPECERPDLRRLVSAPGFRLKGGGWYETDFKKDGKRNLHDSHVGSKPADTGGGAEKSASTDSKKATSEPAAKPSTT